MTPIERYVAFAMGYEQSRRTDDWTGVSRLVADDAVFIYPIQNCGGGIYEGRAGFLLHHKTRQALFNSRFEHSDLASLGTPVLHDDTVSHLVYGAWRAKGLPDLTFEFELRVTLDEDLVVRIEEVWDPEMSVRLNEYVAAHGEKLGRAVPILDLVPTEELELLRRGMRLAERRVESWNDIDSWDGPRTSAQSASAQCRATWKAPGMPDLSLAYALEYRFLPSGEVDVQVRWEPAMSDRLRAHLDAHGDALRKQAAELPRHRTE